MASVIRFCGISPLWQNFQSINFDGKFTFCENFGPALAKFVCNKENILVDVNGQMLKKQFSHLVTLIVAVRARLMAASLCDIKFHL